MVQPICLPDEDFIKNWLDRKYEKMGFADGEPAYDTVVGTRVRSKSEAFISNSLERWEVPQLYEVPLILKGYGKVRPDFMVLNVRTRQEYIWEHLGMLDDPVYLEKAMKSEDRFARGAALIMYGDIAMKDGKESVDACKKALTDGYLRVVFLYKDAEVAEKLQPEALYKAAHCFDKLSQSGRADFMRTELKRSYASSPWANK